MSEKNNLLIKDAENHKKLNPRSKITDEELDEVTGGYWKHHGFAKGYWIECPRCGRYKDGDFKAWTDEEQKVDQFICKCQRSFAVDANGTVYY